MMGWLWKALYRHYLETEIIRNCVSFCFVCSVGWINDFTNGAKLGLYQPCLWYTKPSFYQFHNCKRCFQACCTFCVKPPMEKRKQSTSKHFVWPFFVLLADLSWQVLHSVFVLCMYYSLKDSLSSQFLSSYLIRCYCSNNSRCHLRVTPPPLESLSLPLSLCVSWLYVAFPGYT